MRRIRLFLGYAAALVFLAPTSGRGDSKTAVTGELIIYHAGSLSTGFRSVEAAFKAENPGVVIVDKSFGSVDMARRVTTGGEAADLFATADYQNIDTLLKPKYAAYTIRFAQGGMVLLYHANNPNPLAKVGEIAERRVAFNLKTNPPSIPNAVPEWYRILAQPGVKIAGADPGADPGGYRGVMIMQLAERYYRKPGLYATLRANYVYPGAGETTTDPWDYRFIYESSALVQARTDPTIRFVHLPAEVSLADSAQNAFYRNASVKIPGLAKTDPEVTVTGTRVTWGITVLNAAKHPDQALAFLRFLLTQDKGGALQEAAGPEPILPARVSEEDFGRVPSALHPLVVSVR
jgi:molybdate/tungstate transport system substrate-binding protein